MIQVNTTDILFICGGAFDGITNKIAQRLNTRMVGYGAAKTKDAVDMDNLLQYVAPQDLKAFGLIPEIIGRLPVLTHLDPLDRDTLRKILTEPKNSLIKQYTKIFEIDGKTLEFEPEVLEFIVDKAVEFKVGARGLRSICETIMMEKMFESPSSDARKVEITLDYAREQLSHVSMKRLALS